MERRSLSSCEEALQAMNAKQRVFRGDTQGTLIGHFKDHYLFEGEEKLEGEIRGQLAWVLPRHVFVEG